MFHTSGNISSRPAAFLLLFYYGDTLNSSSINGPSLIYYWQLINFVIGLLMTIGESSNRFLKCSFEICIPSSCLTNFSFALKVLFLLLTSFIACHAIRDCQSYTKRHILLIWHWIYYCCYFDVYYLVFFVPSYVSVLWFVGFLLLHYDVIFT